MTERRSQSRRKEIHSSWQNRQENRHSEEEREKMDEPKATLVSPVRLDVQSLKVTYNFYSHSAASATGKCAKSASSRTVHSSPFALFTVHR